MHRLPQDRDGCPPRGRLGGWLRMLAGRAPAPASPLGFVADDLDTPALLVNLDILERNVWEMAAQASAAGVQLRPHAKTHKSLAIAAMQIAGGARGLACAT